LGQSVVPVFLMHGHVCPIGGSGCHGEGPVAPRLVRGLHMSLEQGISTPRGSGAPVLTLHGSSEAEIVPDRAQGSGTLMTSWARARWKLPPEAPISPRDLFAWLGWDRGWLSA
jgi:hypothetical protein